MKHSPMTIANGSILFIRDEYAEEFNKQHGFKDDVCLLKRTDGSYEYCDFFDLDPTPTLLEHLQRLLERNEKGKVENKEGDYQEVIPEPQAL